MTELKQYCPICQQEVRRSSRYPAYVCDDCAEYATDEAGLNIHFFNDFTERTVNRNGKDVHAFVAIGLGAAYKDTDKPYTKPFFWIKGHKCTAREAYFGGVVYFLANDAKYGLTDTD